jgi:protein-S-isoprenylcysteine O-methyltransferase Ste14
LPTSLVAYAAFKLLISEEDRYLERRFGQAYRNYRLRVREIVPLPRLRSR